MVVNVFSQKGKHGFMVREHLDVGGGNFADGSLSSKSWYFICSHRRWSDLMCSQRCLHDHPHQSLEEETLQCTSKLVKTVVEEIMKVESPKQIHTLACHGVQ